MFSYLYDLVIYPIELILEFIYSFAMEYLYKPGVCIIIVSVVVNFLVLPLYKKSDAMQEKEREKQKAMEHWVSHIKKTFKGDERFLMLSAYYRQQGYKPIYTLRGSFSLLLQIPFFIAAYHFLSHLPALSGTPFWIIPDLSKPDGLIRLGSLKINALPLLMTFFNILSGVIYTKGFTRKEKLQLYAMAGIFLVLLYDSPSGLVFYWTLNNLFSLLKNIVLKLVKPLLPERTPAAPCSRKTDGKLFFLAGLFVTLFAGAVVPLAAISASPAEFLVGMTPGSLVAHNLCIFAGLNIIWFSIFYGLCGVRGKRIFTGILAGLGFAAAANFMLFGKGYGVISTNFVFTSDPEFLPKEKMLSLLVTLALLALALLISLKKSSLGRSVYLILLCGALTLIVTNARSTAKELSRVSALQEEIEAEDEPEIVLNKNAQNVVVLMLDRALSGYLPYIFEEKPELMEQFEGFTYYPNTTSFGSHTVFAAGALFGGYEYTPKAMNEREGEIPELYGEGISVMPAAFSAEGWRVSAFDIPYGGFSWTSDMSVFDPYTEGRSYSILSRYTESLPNIDELSFGQQKRSLFYYSLFKISTVPLQPVIYCDGRYYSTVNSTDVSFLGNYAALCELPKMTVVTDNAENTFTMMNNETTHCNTLLDPESYEPSVTAAAGNRYKYDAEGNEIYLNNTIKASHYQVNAAAFLKLGEWFDSLREQGVWDNTRIILVSDHGYRYLNQFTQYRFLNGRQNTEAYWSLLLMKDFGDSGDFSTDNSYMTIADVPMLATEEVFGTAYALNPFTGALLDGHEKAEPQYVTSSEEYGLNIHRQSSFNTDDGMWYTVSGDIFKAESWAIAE